MDLKRHLLAGLACATLAVPAIAFAADKPAVREDEPKPMEAAENAKIADKADAITERSATFDGHALAHRAKITLISARATALSARPGEITDQELEKEKGGSGLRYSFDVKAGAKVYEVGVDARTGKILENAIEGPVAD